MNRQAKILHVCKCKSTESYFKHLFEQYTYLDANAHVSGTCIQDIAMEADGWIYVLADGLCLVWNTRYECVKGHWPYEHM